MLRNLIIVILLNLSVAFAAEPIEQKRIIQILAVAKEVEATDVQVAIAVANGITPEEFATQVANTLRLIAPDKVPVGTPVRISVEGMPEKAAELWRRHPEMPTDVWLELYDRNGKPVNIFWSSDQGPRTFELIMATNGPETPLIEIASHKLQYGALHTLPEPPTPLLQATVAELAAFSNRVEAQDLLNLTEFYLDFADVVRRDGLASKPVVNTTSIFRSTYMNAGGLMFQQTGMQGKYDGMAEIVDSIITSELGLDIVPFDAQKTAEVLNAVAWAYYQGGK